MADPAESGTRLRIASYNTRDFLDDRRAAARVVRAIDPDILCLQEVPRRLFAGWRVRRFANEVGMRWPGGHRGSGGTTIFLSDRVQLERTSHRRLTVALHMRTRGYALARLIVPGSPPLVVTSIHLSLHAGERHAHTTEIVRAVSAARGEDGRAIIAGDLNELETGSAWRRIAAGMTLISPTAPTFPAKQPRTLLDVIFASPDITVLPHVPIELDQADVVAGSDHRPVWADIVV